MPDHVHVLVQEDPQVGIHNLVKAITGRSSRLLRNEFPWLRSRLPSPRINSHSVATAGARLSEIKDHIETQKGH